MGKQIMYDDVARRKAVAGVVQSDAQSNERIRVVVEDPFEFDAFE